MNNFFAKYLFKKKIEKNLNIKLESWQIDFIFNDRPFSNFIRYGRCNGKTLASILKLLYKQRNSKVFSLREMHITDPDWNKMSPATTKSWYKREITGILKLMKMDYMKIEYYDPREERSAYFEN